MSDTNWISDIIDCIWHSIDTDTDLMTTGDGWRAQNGKGMNFKLDSDSHRWHDAKAIRAHMLPAIAIFTKGGSEAAFGMSYTNNYIVGISVQTRIHTRDGNKAFKFVTLVCDNLSKNVRSRFVDEPNNFTNTIIAITSPSINFENIWVSDDNIWEMEITFNVQARRFVTGT